MEANIKYAVLHDVLAMPTPSTKLLNFKATLDPNSIEGKERQLKMTWLGEVVRIEAGGGVALIPIANFKLLVPSTETKG